jgi:hypothetical protein
MFDTTQVGVPYIRINNINIEYPAPNTANVTFSEQQFVPLADGSHVALGGDNSRTFRVNPSDMATSIPLVSPETGEPLGAEMTYGQIMLGILAALRANQGK